MTVHRFLWPVILTLPALAVDTPSNPVTALAFHPANGQLVSGGYGEVLVWDIAKSALDHRIPGLIGRVRALAFSKDGARLAIAEGQPGRSGAIRLLDFATGHVLFTLDQQKDECYAVAFSPDDKLIAGGAPDGTVRIWTSTDGKLVTTLKQQSGWITGLAFSPNGKWLAASSADRTASVWTTEDWKRLTTIPENPAGPVNAVAFSPDNSILMLAIGGFDISEPERAIRIWRTEAATPSPRQAALLKATRPIDVGPGVPAGLAFCGGKNVRLFVSTTEKYIRVLNPNGGTVTTYTGDTDWVDSIAVNADGTRVASGNGSGAVLIRDGANGKVLATLK